MLFLCLLSHMFSLHLLTRSRTYCSFSRFTFPSLNSHVTSLLSNNPPSTFQYLLQSHALVITSGNSSSIFVASKLIALYAYFSKPRYSSKVFCSVCSSKDSFLWNSIIKSHYSNAQYFEAFRYYLQMRFSGTLPNDFTIPMVAGACAELGNVWYGRYVHGLALKVCLLRMNSAVGSSFIYMYAKCGSTRDAYIVFDEMCLRDVIAWTALVIGYVQNGENQIAFECFCEMHRVGGVGEKPNFRTFEGAFQACGNLGDLAGGRGLHSLAVKVGLGTCQVVQSSVLSMYSKCGDVHESYRAFHEVVDKDLISWTSIIGVHARHGFIKECLNMFWEMQNMRIFPDGIMISCLLLAFGNFMSACEGKAFHGLLMRRHLLMDQMCYTALLSMYCKFRNLSISEKIFVLLPEHKEESWNAMVSGYHKMGHEAKCISLFRGMQQLLIRTDLNCLASVISSCTQVGALSLGRSIHCFVVKNRIDGDISVINKLIDMYGKSGSLTYALRMFCRANGDIITWNTMISSYIYNQRFDEAMDLFDEMVAKGLNPDIATLTIIVSACSRLASWEKGERIHHSIRNGGYELSQSLATALVDMYAKCGQLQKAQELFDSLKERDLVAWNVIISAYGIHGDAKSAIEMYQQMELLSCVKPNELTFISLLSACAHAGLVEDGKYLFKRMRHYSLNPNLKHYACMVDLLGRSGNLQEAEAMVKSMPFPPDGGIWGALLNSCLIHNKVDMGLRLAKFVIESDPENDGYYVMISNMYSSMGLCEEADRIREMMKERHVGKRAGCSLINLQFAFASATKQPRFLSEQVMKVGRSLQVWKMGTVNYLDALKLQQKLVSDRKVNKIPDTLLSLQHPPTYTLGKRRTDHNLLISPNELKMIGAELHYTERGGDITFHGPQQAILYPIISLRAIGIGARKYVEKLECTMIRLASLYGVEAHAGRSGETGVWVDEKKIGAIGVRISGGITSHGLAFNISPDLNFFKYIVPCGIADKEVTTLERETSMQLPLEEVIHEQLVSCFTEQFDYGNVTLK